MKTKLAGAGVAAVALGAWMAPVGASGAVQPGCTPATNVEAIIDDSGSMTVTDTGRLRFNGMQLFIAQNPQDTLGAVEFGTSANVVFPPTPVAGSQSSMISALDAAIQADSGSTNYVDAFKTAHGSNPGAQARIFLTDGGQNINNIDATNDHLGWGGPVYVIGLDIGAPGQGSSDADRLQRIATGTGGTYFPNVTSTGTSGVANSSLQDVIATISSTLQCKGTPAAAAISTLQASGQSATQNVPVDPGAKNANITLNWGNSGNQYRVTQVLVRLHGRTVATANVPPATAAKASSATASAARKHRRKVKKPSKLSVQAQGGPTFETLNVSGLKAGTLVYKVQATNVAAPETVSALVSQS
jgi:hypothetical protein